MIVFVYVFSGLFFGVDVLFCSVCIFVFDRCLCVVVVAFRLSLCVV